MKKNILLLSFLCVLIFYFLNSCSADKTSYSKDNCAETVTYNNQIQPILNAKCGTRGCHNATDAVAGVITDNYASLKPYLENGIFKDEVITTREMPKGDNNSLTSEEYDLIVCWEQQGFLESSDITNTSVDLCPNAVVTYSEDVKTLLLSKCGNSGCHNNTSLAGNLDVNSYSSILSTINSGSFESMIFEGGKASSTVMLLQPELDLLYCWKKDNYAEGPPGTCAGNFTYHSVKSILQKHCEGCHNASAPAGGVNVTTYSGMSATLISSGVNPSSFELRVLIQKNMPPLGNQPLSESEMDSLICWKNAGFPEN